MHVHVKGFEVHSSLLPEGVSAIMEGARLIQWVNDRTPRSGPPAGPLAAVPRPSRPACRHDPGRDGGQHHRRRLPLCGGNALRAGRRHRGHAGAFRPSGAAGQGAESAASRGGGASGRFFDVPALAPEEDGEAEALARAPDRRQCDGRGQLWHRGRAVPGCGLFGHGLWAGRHCPGAPAGRISWRSASFRPGSGSWNGCWSDWHDAFRSMTPARPLCRGAAAPRAMWWSSAAA
jgi:hypothetical protein